MHDPMAEAIKKKRAGLTISIDVDQDGGMKASQVGSELAPEAPELDEDPAEVDEASDLAPPDLSKESPELKAQAAGQVPAKAMATEENDEGTDMSMFDDIAADLNRSGKPPKSLTERASADRAKRMTDEKKPQK